MRASPDERPPRCRVQAAPTRRRAAKAECIDIGLVNNMPDAALEKTERQFIGLLNAAAGGRSTSAARTTTQNSRQQPQQKKAPPKPAARGRTPQAGGSSSNDRR